MTWCSPTILKISIPSPTKKCWFHGILLSFGTLLAVSMGRRGAWVNEIMVQMLDTRLDAFRTRPSRLDRMEERPTSRSGNCCVVWEGKGSTDQREQRMAFWWAGNARGNAEILGIFGGYINFVSQSLAWSLKMKIVNLGLVSCFGAWRWSGTALYLCFLVYLSHGRGSFKTALWGSSCLYFLCVVFLLLFNIAVLSFFVFALVMCVLWLQKTHPKKNTDKNQNWAGVKMIFSIMVFRISNYWLDQFEIQIKNPQDPINYSFHLRIFLILMGFADAPNVWLGWNLPHSRGNVVKYSLHGASGFWFYLEKMRRRQVAFAEDPPCWVVRGCRPAPGEPSSGLWEPVPRSQRFEIFDWEGEEGRHAINGSSAAKKIPWVLRFLGSVLV